MTDADAKTVEAIRALLVEVEADQLPLSVGRHAFVAAEGKREIARQQLLSLSTIATLLHHLNAVKQERDALVKWKGREQTALLSMAATLAVSGFKGDGVAEGVDWLADKRTKAESLAAEAVAERDALAAEVRTLKAQQAWQPIETADANMPVVLFTPRDRLTDLPVHIAPDITAEIRVSAPRYWTWATHWQPLPSPPPASEQEPTR